MMKHLRRRLLMAIFNNDLGELRATLQHVQKTLGREALDDLLTKRRRLPPMGQEHDPALLHVLTVLLLDRLPDLTPRHFASPKLMLQTHVQAYRGLPIHVAVALRRLRIVEELMDTASTYHLDISNQLRATDTCRNTALSLAVRNCDYDATCSILEKVKECMTYYTFILRHCLAQNSRQLIYCDHLTLIAAVDRVFYRLWLFDDESETQVSLLWNIASKDSNVDFILEKPETVSVVCAQHEPSPFHFAAATCCNEKAKRYGILHSLENHRQENCWAAPNDISTLKIGNKTHLNGTAAHFALVNYRPPHMQQIHPGYDSRGRLDPRPVISASHHHDLAGDTLEMLGYLQEGHSVDLFKPNHEQKTPLDCLPPDADPILIHYPIATHKWRQTEQPTVRDNGETLCFMEQ